MFLNPVISNSETAIGMVGLYPKHQIRAKVVRLGFSPMVKYCPAFFGGPWLKRHTDSKLYIQIWRPQQTQDRAANMFDQVLVGLGPTARAFRSDSIGFDPKQRFVVKPPVHLQKF